MHFALNSPHLQNDRGTNGIEPYYLLLVGSISLIVIAAYWQALALPFIQDDWTLLEFAKTNDPLSMVKSAFELGDNFFYRPMGKGYIFLMYGVFGDNPIPFHAAALTIHAINSFLIALVIDRVTRDRAIAYLTALIYAAAIAIHLDPLAWAVGIYDLGATLFFLFSMWLFLRSKYLPSAIAFFIGLIFKEPIIVLPLILLSYQMIMTPRDRWKELVLANWKRTLPFFAAIGMVLLIRTMGVSMLDVPASHPYAIDFLGGHVADNALSYFGWMFQSFVPIILFNAKLSLLLMGALSLLLVIWIISALTRQANGPQTRVIFFFIAWILISLSPVLFLPNHAYRYYAVYALPAFIALFLSLGKYVMQSIGARKNIINAVLAFIGVLALTSSIFMANKVYREDLYQRTLSDGTNLLIARAATVDIVREGLYQQLPTLPVYSSIIVGGVDLWSFNKQSGPQFWYDDSTLRVYDITELIIENGQPVVVNAVENQTETYTGGQKTRTPLDPSRLYIFMWSDGQLVRQNLADVVKNQ